MYRVVTHLLGHFEPGLFETEDRTSVERGGDLKHGVVIMETAANVRHSHPFLNDRYSGDHVV